MESTTPLTRLCTQCHQEKPLETDFGRQSNGKYGRQSACKACTRRILLEYRKTPKGKAKPQEYARRHRQKAGYLEKRKTYTETPRAIWRAYRHGALRRSLPFELTVEDFATVFWQQPCWYCGDLHKTAGVDRVVNDLGYTLANTVPCCSECNFMKLQSSQEAFIAKCKQVAARH